MLHDTAPARLSAYFVSFVVLFRRICHSPRREAYIASGTGSSRLWQGCPIPASAVACKAHERRRNPPQVSGRP